MSEIDESIEYAGRGVDEAQKYLRAQPLDQARESANS